MAKPAPSTSESSSYSEKRKTPRAGGEFHLVLSGDTHRPEKKVRVRDVSSSGISCHLDTEVKEMTQVRIDLLLPNEEEVTKISADGAVVRCREIKENPAHQRYEVAIFFTGITDDGRLSIERYVMNQLKTN